MHVAGCSRSPSLAAVAVESGAVHQLAPQIQQGLKGLALAPLQLQCNFATDEFDQRFKT